MSGDFDKAIAVFTLASGAAAVNYEVNLFFTFWGLNNIKVNKGRAFIGKGVLGELDFWGGNFFLILFGTVEVILFAWVFGMDRAWTELHAGSDITLGGGSRPLLLLTGQDAPGEGRGVGGIRAARGHDLSGGVFTPGRFRCVP